MEYNTQRNQLIIAEYGRNIQKMVEQCCNIPDKIQRTNYAMTIITAMSQINPQGKENPHYFQQLWDHMFIISDYKLDVDSPYPKPVKPITKAKPTPLKYKNSKIKYRPYGIVLEKMIAKVSKMQDGSEKQYLTNVLAQEMKRSYLQWNINTCQDSLIIEYFNKLSNGLLSLSPDFQFKTQKELLPKKAHPNKKPTPKSNNKTKIQTNRRPK